MLTGRNPSVFDGKTRAVERLSWQQAVEFCIRLSDLPAERAADRRYRLPTEAEWEYACRGCDDGLRFRGTHSRTFRANFCRSGLESLNQLIPSVCSPRTLGDCTTCTATSGSGVRTGIATNTTRSRQSMTPFSARPEGLTMSYGAVPRRYWHMSAGCAMRGESRSDGPNSASSARFEFIGDFGLRVVCEDSGIHC